MWEKYFVVLVVSIAFVSAKPTRHQRATGQCGYDGCPKTSPDKLNIHIVPHSHDDVGWLKTVDQYYYGSQTSIQRAGVQYILDSTIQELLKNPERRFVQVESAFFFKWWKEQTEELQKKVKELVNEGRLEFIGGAWSMNDEATTHYQGIIDEFTLGLRLLNDTFGECGRPRVGWQIDMFGHSREMASILAQMGFDGQFFARLDHRDKATRIENRSMEAIWRGNDDLGSETDLFTGVLYRHYSPPPGFCFDLLCSDEPIIDGENSPDNNVDRRLQSLTSYLETMSTAYRSNHLMVPMGDDFHYQDANMWYKNLDKLIKYANERRTELNLFYSSPSCYLKSLSEDNNTKWPTKVEDFFPYSSDSSSFWTGFFTSRPSLKRSERVGNHFLQICKQLTAATTATATSVGQKDARTRKTTGGPGSTPKSFSSMLENLQTLQEAMGIMQHHDAVTGTEKAHVASDYSRLLTAAIDGCGLNAREVLNEHVQKRGGQLAQFEFDSCPALNISSCEMSEKLDRFMVTVYNVLGKKTSQYVRIPIQDLRYVVKDHQGDIVDSQIVQIPEAVRKLHFRFSVALKELVFQAKDVPPNGFRSYYIEADATDVSSIPEVVLIRKPRKSEKTVIRSNEMDLTFDSRGRLRTVTMNGITRQIKQEFLYYHGMAGINQNRASGAYIFRPNGTTHQVNDDTQLYLVQGPLVDEVHQQFNEWISQVIRVYKGTNYIEFEWLVGPIPVADGIGREVVTRFSTDIKSAGEFYTDSNGRQTLKRIRNHRPDYEPVLTESVSGNYYPIISKIAIGDAQTRLAVLTDRAQGGSSLTDGTIEVMVHRRLLYDDGFGVGEPLNSLEFGKGEIAIGKHFLTLGPTNSDIREQERQIQLEKTLPLWLFFSDVKSQTYDEWRTGFTHEKSLWPVQLPPNIHLMTLEPLGTDRLLLRFEHILEETDEPSSPQEASPRAPTVTVGAKPITFDIGDFLKSIGYTKSIRRTALAGNLWFDDIKRLQFNKEATNDNDVNLSMNDGGNGAAKGHVFNGPRRDDSTSFTLKPMEIVSLIVERY